MPVKISKAVVLSIVLLPVAYAQLGRCAGEDRKIICRDSVFEDEFKPWGVHLYRISE